MSQTHRGEHEARWHLTPAFAIAVAGGPALAGLGLLCSRPDVVALGLPLAIWAAVVLVRRPGATRVRIIVESAAPGDETGSTDVGAGTGVGVSTDVVVSTVEVHADAEIAQLAISQGRRTHREVDAAARGGVVHARSRLLHSGPTELLGITGRLVSLDGAVVSSQFDAAQVDWNAMPQDRRITALPLSPRLRGLHGSHEGGRPGQGGDFRDIHPFAPGDELRRVDWRATARLARRPGELLVRRTNTLSDASVVIVMDTADDLGTSVASWGRDDPERSGPTSLDAAREAARSIAASAIDAGDRVAFNDLSAVRRSLRSGSGPRHLARVVAAIAATGVGEAEVRVRRTPPVPTGSVIYMLSTFFDGSAAELALMWRAAGNRVVAIDTLPATDAARLTPTQRLALRTLMAERADVFHDLAHSGVDVIPWGADPEAAVTALRLAARARR